MPSRLLLHSSRRHYARHPWQLALSILGVALGVAVVVGVDLATGSAQRAFSLSTEAVAGRATHQVLGGPAGLPDSIYRLLKVDAGVREAAPVVEGWVRAGGAGGLTLHLLGVDPFAEAPFRGYVARAGGPTGEGGEGSVMTRRGAIVLSAATATTLGVAPGDEIALTVGDREVGAVLAGVLRSDDDASERALADLALADISTAQELLGRVGEIDRVDLRLADDDAGQAELARIRGTLPPGANIVEAAARAEAVGGMTRAFDLNLAALSLLALIFGMFLIYNSVTFSVVQRRQLIGLLRAMGVTRREVFGLVMTEAALLGVVATTIGVALGIVLGEALLRLVARTINDLYFAVTVRQVTITPMSLAKGIALGVGATLVAAAAPAAEATAAVPRAALARSELESRARTLARRGGVAGFIMLGGGLALMLAPGGGLLIAFIAIFVVLIGVALMAPITTVGLMRLVHPLAGRLFGGLGRMAARGVGATLSRTGPAIAALVVAVAVGTGVGVMIDSFRDTVARWLDRTLQADIYVSAPGTTARRSESTLEPDFVRRIAEARGVSAVSRYRTILLPLADGDLRLVAIDMAPAHRAAFSFLEGDPARIWPAFDSASGVLVSESWAYRRGAHPGSTLRLPTDRGERTYPIVAVFRDYASEHGVVFMSRRTYLDAWNDPAITSLGVFATADADPDSLIARLRALDTGARVVSFRPNRGLREASLEIFDRTFAITAVLRLLALAVAFVGVLSALMAVQLERGRELAVLRATGLTPGQLWALVTSETGLMGLAAAVLSTPLGLLLAWAMIHVVNRRSFGWTIDMRVDGGIVLQAFALAIISSILAGMYPAWRMARTRPAMGLREE